MPDLVIESPLVRSGVLVVRPSRPACLVGDRALLTALLRAVAGLDPAPADMRVCLGAVRMPGPGGVWGWRRRVVYVEEAGWGMVEGTAEQIVRKAGEWWRGGEGRTAHARRAGERLSGLLARLGVEGLRNVQLARLTTQARMRVVLAVVVACGAQVVLMDGWGEKGERGGGIPVGQVLAGEGVGVIWRGDEEDLGLVREGVVVTNPNMHDSQLPSTVVTSHDKPQDLQPVNKVAVIFAHVESTRTTLLAKATKPEVTTNTARQTTHATTVHAQFQQLLPFSVPWLIIGAAQVAQAKQLARDIITTSPDILSNAVSSATSGPINMSILELLITALPMIGVMLLSKYLSLGIHKDLMIGAVRAFCQLSILGYFLVPIFYYNRPWMVLGCLLLMLIVASHEAARRSRYRYPRMTFWVFGCLSFVILLTGVFAFGIVIRSGLDAQYVIPVSGMVMGGTLSGASVALSTILTEFAERKSRIESLLALGATRWEAAEESIQLSVKLGLTPTMNLMAVTGIVSIPGMMTGQILGGTPPQQAARYQIFILFLMATCSCITLLSVACVSVYNVTDAAHRVRADRLSFEEAPLGNTVQALVSSWKRLQNWRRSIMECRSPVPVQKSGSSVEVDYGAIADGGPTDDCANPCEDEQSQTGIDKASPNRRVAASNCEDIH